MGVSLRKAINEHCKSCGYDEADKGNWRQQIMACPVVKCSLYPVRPISSSKAVKATETVLISSTGETL